MSKQWFKKPKSGIERAFVLPTAAAGHFIFGLMLAFIFINLRIALIRQGMTGVFIDAFLGGLSFFLTGLLLNLLPTKFVKDLGVPPEGEK